MGLVVGGVTCWEGVAAGVLVGGFMSVTVVALRSGGGVRRERLVGVGIGLKVVDGSAVVGLVVEGVRLGMSRAAAETVREVGVAEGALRLAMSRAGYEVMASSPGGSIESSVVEKPGMPIRMAARTR